MASYERVANWFALCTSGFMGNLIKEFDFILTRTLSSFIIDAIACQNDIVIHFAGFCLLPHENLYTIY